MSTYLLQLSIGPVQDFIATARRSRDLWFGSRLLSEVSKAVAKSLADLSGCTLIFPNPTNLDQLKPDDKFSGDFLVANIVLAEIDCADKQAAVRAMEHAKDAARTRWMALCKLAWDDADEVCQGFNLGSVTRLLRKDVWDKQQDDVLELFGALVPVGGNYAAANCRLRDLLAQRKSTRAFRQFVDDASLPKSSLDGQRSTVLQELPADQRMNKRHQRFLTALGIEPAEQLDLPGLVKRVLGRKRAFIPVARVAADAWLEAHSAELATTSVEYEQVERLNLGFATKLDDKRYEDYDWLINFSFDAQLLYRSRIEAARNDLERLGLEGPEMEDAKSALDALQQALKPIWDGHGQPTPYYALLQADGDRMGELIDAATKYGANAHRVISSALSAFAQAVPDLVMTKYSGACIYSGGDDVLALVRVDKALACAETLKEHFLEHIVAAIAMIDFAADDKSPTPSLSVGIAVAHMLDPLGDVRQLAVRAEKLAKRGEPDTPKGLQRNALGLIIKPRSGGEYVLRLRWDDSASLKRLNDLVRAFAEDEVPSRLPYELRQILTLEEELLGGKITSTWPPLCARILERKDFVFKDETHANPMRKRLFDALTKGFSAGEVPMQRINQMLCARWLSGRVGDQEA